MTNLARLKLELGNKAYFTDEEYISFLNENDLSGDSDYNKEESQKNLLFTVLDILEAVSNDIDLMRSVETEFATVSAAYEHLVKRIAAIKERIAAIPEPDEEYSCFSLMFARNR